MQLTEEQKNEICGVIVAGCRRETALRYVGCSQRRLARAMRKDKAFARRLLRTEAAVEVAQMQRARKAAEDPKNYRAAIWWLENAAPQGYLRRSSDAISQSELKGLLNSIARAAESEVSLAADRAKLAATIQQIADEHLDELDDVLELDITPPSDPTEPPPPPGEGISKIPLP